MSFCLELGFSRWNFRGFRNFVLPDITAEINPAGITPSNSGTLIDCVWERPPAKVGVTNPAAPVQSKLQCCADFFQLGKTLQAAGSQCHATAVIWQAANHIKLAPLSPNHKTDPQKQQEISYHQLLILLFIATTIAK